MNFGIEDTVFLDGINFEEWRYRYNPFGERESKMRWQKSYYYGSLSPVNAWVYYSLGTSNEQNVVYQGFETSESMIYGRNTLVEMYQNYSQAPVLFMYPVEYNVFANGRNPVMTYKYDPLAAGWRKYFNIYDELGSVALVINDSGRVVESNQYKAFGVKDYTFKERPQATGYIGKEKDAEMNLADHGVRKYDSDLGRFLCSDAMWDSQLSFSPYHYCYNNPIKLIDENGLLPGDPFESASQAAHDFGKNYIGLTKENKVEYGTMIYSYAVNGETKYSYMVPEKGSAKEVNHSNRVPKDAKIESEIHTHTSNNIHSKDKDIKTADKHNLKINVVTQNGQIWMYDPKTKELTQTHSNVNKSEKDKRPIPEVDEVDEVDNETLKLK